MNVTTAFYMTESAQNSDSITWLCPQVALLIMVTLTLFPILQRTIPESYQACAQPAPHSCFSC